MHCVAYAKVKSKPEPLVDFTRLSSSPWQSVWMHQVVLGTDLTSQFQSQVRNFWNSNITTANVFTIKSLWALLWWRRSRQKSIHSSITDMTVSIYKTFFVRMTRSWTLRYSMWCFVVFACASEHCSILLVNVQQEIQKIQFRYVGQDKTVWTELHTAYTVEALTLLTGLITI